MAKIAIAGASGFVGKILLKALSSQHELRALGRSKPSHSENQIEWKATELFSATSTVEALKGMDVAIYLVHSMMPSSRLFQGNFHDTDLLLADNFAHACKVNGIKQIIYLGGLVPEGYISPHLQSRREVEGVLQSSGVPVTVLRAGMIVGPGGSSFEILRSLVKKLPLMVLPKWTQSDTQAVFIDDVIRVIQNSVLNPAFLGKTFDVVNGESLTYETILNKTANVLGLKRVMFPVPVASTGFSKLWVQVFGNSTYELVSPLIDSLLCNLPQLQPVPEIASLIHFPKFEGMIEETLRRDQGYVAARPKRKVAHQDSVRSIQRLPGVSLSCHDIAMEYAKWLPTFFPLLLKVDVSEETNRVEIFLTFFRKPLLIMNHIKETFFIDREKFHIVGGILSKTTNTGWLEFRQIDHRKYTLASIHEFVPRLPWMIYIFTQAPLHRLVMYFFGRHLRELAFERERNAKPVH